MRIWIDADACPRPVKEIVFRASARLGIEVCLVADKPMPIPDSPLVTALQVEKGMDAADERIAREAAPGDLVVTADIPLAATVVKKGALALDPRGDLYTKDTIGQRLPMRDLMMSLREVGAIEGGGPRPFGPADRRRFAAALDSFLTRTVRESPPAPPETE
jgi:uncharacterized protein YaiI (UPF0178 family)